jgi:hypothetical protein
MAAPAGMNPILAAAAQSLGSAIGTALGQAIGQALFGNNSADAANAAAAAEAARQAAIAQQLAIERAIAAERALEEQRRQAMFARLGQELKGLGSADLSLKSMDDSGAGGLQLKSMDDSAQPAKPDDCASKSWGIPGLPGVYLNDCHEQPSITAAPDAANPPNPIQVATVAENLPEPARDVVEQAVLNSAQTDPALMAPSSDPNVTAFQQADKDYQQALQAQTAAQQQVATDDARVASDQSVIQMVNSKIDAATASPAQQAALGQMAAAAKSDEDASALARQGFDTAAGNVTVTRNNATVALSRVPPSALGSNTPASNTVDLSHATQPLAPLSLKTQPPAITLSPTIAGTPAAPPLPTRTDNFSAPGALIFDCATAPATIARLTAGLPAQEDAIRRTEAAIEAASKDQDDARNEAAIAAMKALFASATTISNWAQLATKRTQAASAASTIQKLQFLELLSDLSGAAGDLINVTQLPKDIPKTYNAGFDASNELIVEQSAKTLREKSYAIMKFLSETGFGEELAGQIALYGFGPGGPVAEALVHTISNAIDVGIDVKQSWNSAAEVQQALKNLTVMRQQETRVRDKIQDLQIGLAHDCPATASMH